MLKQMVQKWIAFKNLPMLKEVSKISYSMEQIYRNQRIMMMGGECHCNLLMLMMGLNL